VAVLLDVFVGLRWGELSALRWSDIDDEQQVIRVERGNYEGKVVSSTKTGDEDDPHAKLVPLLPEAKALLEERRVQMIAKQHKGLKEGWIFPTTEGTLYKGSPLRAVIDDALTACNIDRRVTPHGLRHTANNELRKVANGEVVRSIIGHATEVMTHHYSHVDENEKRAAVARVFSIVKGAAGADRGADRSGSTTKSEAEVPEMLGGATQI
jgi:integrase